MVPFVLFFLSGALSLVYEVVWVRAVTLEFGSTTLAVSSTVSTFMGGLAVGSWLGGRRADRLSKPLQAYGLLEFVLGLYAALTPLLLPLLLGGFARLSQGFASSFWALSLVRFVASAIVLLPPTILMGATLPLLASACSRGASEAGRRVGLLYGVNTLGALTGTVLAGFVLLPAVGLWRTMLLTSAVNLVLGAVAWTAGRRPPAPAGAPASAESRPRPEWGVLSAVALTGFAAMVCQVVWTRVLSIVLGGSVYVFSIVLAVFLGGLGLGAAGASALLKEPPGRTRVLFGVLALACAVSVLTSTVTFSALPTLFSRWFWSWDLTGDFDRVLWVQVLLSALVMAFPVLLMGGLFPAAVRVIVSDPARAGHSVGRLYAWNTVGAIAGAAMAAFVLIPALGIRGAVGTALAAQCGGAAAVGLGGAGRSRWAIGAASVLVLAASLVLMPSWDRQLMTAGVYDNPHRFQSHDPRALSREEELLFYRDGLMATVTVTRDPRAVPPQITIRTNGKVDGSSGGDMPTQRLSAHLPLLLHPRPRQVCVIGLGTGCTAGSAALHPVDRVVAVEIEQAMVEGARLFASVNHQVHSHPKVDLRVTDGRHFLSLHPDAFDVVISEPSNPWLAGTSDLFTVQFFRRGAASLREGGLFCQWIHLYELSLDNLRTVVRTFLEAFPHVYLACSLTPSDLLLVGSLRPIPLDFEAVRRTLEERSAAAADLADPLVNVRSVPELLSVIRMGTAEVRAFAGEGPVNTDESSLLAHRAPRDLFVRTQDRNQEALDARATGVGTHLTGLPADPKARAELFRALSAAYRNRFPTGREHLECRRLAERANRQGP